MNVLSKACSPESAPTNTGYAELASILVKKIVAGHLAVGSLPPTEREIARHDCFSRHTECATLSLMQDLGWFASAEVSSAISVKVLIHLIELIGLQCYSSSSRAESGVSMAPARAAFLEHTRRGTGRRTCLSERGVEAGGGVHANQLARSVDSFFQRRPFSAWMRYPSAASGAAPRARAERPHTTIAPPHALRAQRPRYEKIT